MPETLNVLSLFSGIPTGGLELGLERAGMATVGQVEMDPFCQRVLAKHWPEVPRHDDVRTTVDWWSSSERPRVDLVCGGFPCQPVSVAGRQLAQADPRWLWPAFAAIVRDLRPRYVLVENVPGLLGHGIGDVLGDLAELRYDAEWDRVPAAFVGAPHLRGRIFIVAHSNSPRLGERRRAEPVPPQYGSTERRGEDVANAGSGRHGASTRVLRAGGDGSIHRGGWAAEPDVGRVAHGVPSRVDRLRTLGNAVVPQVAEYVGRLIVDHAASQEVA